jgi:hypothetical protein
MLDGSTLASDVSAARCGIGFGQLGDRARKRQYQKKAFG